MTDEAKLERGSMGMIPASDGWFVLNARDSRWFHAPGRSALCEFEGEPPFPQVGVNLSVLAPGQAMSMYHWEADQEDFLVLAGEGLLIIEGRERPLRPWDFVHCPPGTSHVIVGAGHVPCLVLAIGARDRSTGEDWGAYPVEPAALRHDAGVERETADPPEAYVGLRRRKPVPYDHRWLPETVDFTTNAIVRAVAAGASLGATLNERRRGFRAQPWRRPAGDDRREPRSR